MLMRAWPLPPLVPAMIAPNPLNALAIRGLQ